MKKKIYTRKRHLILLIGLITILLGTFDEAMADSYSKEFTGGETVTFTQVSGTTRFKVAGDDTEYTDIGTITLNTAGITVTFIFNSGTFYINGRINVLQGRLIIQPNGNKKPVLKRQSGYTGLMFYVNNTTSTSAAKSRLDIKGTSATYKVTIDGGATWSVTETGSNANGWEAVKTDGVTAKNPMFYFRGGYGDFQFVNFQNAWNDGSTFQGGAFRIYTVPTGDNPSKSRNYVKIDKCIITNCYCKGQAGAMQLGGGLVTSNSDVIITNSTIDNCFSQADEELNAGGGIFRTGGNGTCNLTMEDCTLKNNKSNATGVITWNSGHAPLTLTRCTFEDNYTLTHGGALSLYSAATITGCTFSRNYAKGNGGAIFYYTYSNTETNMPNFTPQNGTLSIDATTKIQNNTAEINGGGLWISIRPITCKNASGNLYTVYNNDENKQYEVHLTIDGATISGNTAGGLGGGIYLRRMTDIYKTDLNFNYGTVEKNTATTNGGGFYVTSNLDGTIYGTCPYSRTDFNVYVGKSGTTEKATVSGNKANNGGGIYATGVKLNFNVYANAEIGKSGTGNANQALDESTGAGGGVYFNGQLNGSSYGSFTMNGGNIDYNTSVANGAGIYIGNGTCTIKGGTITYNKSTTGSGGGIFVNPAGTGAVTALNSTSAALSVSNNEAVHGGGIFVEKGSLTVTKGTNALTINSNTAKTASTGSGGGVFAKGTVTISGATLSGNKAEGSKGGGIYSASDNITIESSASITDNKAVDGGGIYAASGNITITGSTLSGNTASENGGGLYVAGSITLNSGTVIKSNTGTTNGGGVYVDNGTFTMNAGTIGGSETPNTATNGNGGGVYVTGSDAKVDIKGGAISYNTAPSTITDKGRGGGIYVDSTGDEGTSVSGSASVNNNTAQQYGGGVYVVNGKFTLGGATISSNTATANDGGGVYLGGGTFNLNADGVIDNNKATSGNGGGVFMAGGTFNHSGGSIGSLFASPNKAINGGGLYVNNGIYSSTNTSSAIIGNEATGDGGGIYMAGGTCNLKGGHIGDDGGTKLNKAVNGGGLYMAGSGTFNMTDATAAGSYIRGNQATSNGGGIYMEGGTCTITYGTIGASGYPNEATNGGGIFANGGTIIINGGDVNYNSATYGGGIYANKTATTSSTVDVTSGDINNNTASTSGGGIFVKGIVNFSDGTVSNNIATSGDGGGVFIYSGGTFNVSGTAVMTGNNVPSGQGGGVYQGGIMTADGNSLSISSNTKGTAKTTTNNNVYLPDQQTIKVLENIDPTGVNLGITTENVATENDHTTDIPVLSADLSDVSQLEEIYEALQDGNSRILDDRHMHKPRYITGETILYFTRLTYDYDAYTTDFSGDINSVSQLYKFMCWVNGINGFDVPHPTAEGNVTADINMGSILHWVPIGENELGQSVTSAFQGTFNGHGHVISNLSVDATSGYTNYGLFGQTEGATICDVYMDGFNFAKSSDAGTLGSIIGLMAGGSLSGCSASGTLTATDEDCITGGLVGKLQKNGSLAGTIHSSSAMADMTGYTLGGLVGDLATDCNLYNCFTNPKFTYNGSGSEFVGGLAAENSGTIQNCYVRFTRASSLGSAKFGQIVGDNNSSVSVCYHPTTYHASISSALVNDGSVSSTEYGDVVAPYLYNHDNDNIVVGTSDNLCKKLNDWVSINNSTPNQPICVSWKRTMAGDYSVGAGNINGDYPIHKYSGYTCAASTNGINLDYAATLDAMLARHTANTTVNLYANDRTISSTGNGVVVYIDENVSLLQDMGEEVATSIIKAYTCQTIPGTPRSWHYISSSLKDSGIGFGYTTDAQFNWLPDPCGLTFSSDNDHALFPSDTPDVSSMDLYCFYEPEYHWINFKRSSNSHWHMNTTDVPINYTNEDDLVPGKGYLVSIDQDQLLQNCGTLNNGSVTVSLNYTAANAWAGLLGYNLVGNPYQSYLNFTRFAADNRGIWSENTEPTYAVYDDAEGGYVQYKEGTSRGARAASGTLNMHQGFLVRTASASSITFTNSMRTNEGSGVTFREEQPAYPLINLKVTDDEGVNDFAVLELGREAEAGAEKLKANDSKGWIYLRNDGENYGILFRGDVDIQPLWFDATDAGTYTLGWEMANCEFEALTLVDNITGTMTDMLERDSYVFEADPEQYASRFKIVIGDWKGIDEPESLEPVEGSTTFAFMNNGTLVVNGEGRLEIVDMLGRVICVEELHGSQSRVSMPRCVVGVYVLQLTCGGTTKVQKLVLE